jgi:predicted RecB family endonuclease
MPHPSLGPGVDLDGLLGDLTEIAELDVVALHEVEVLAVESDAIRVSGIEAVDGTPVHSPVMARQPHHHGHPHPHPEATGTMAHTHS